MKRKNEIRLKKLLIMTLIISLGLTLITGCGGNQTSGGGNVVIAGSTSVQPLSEELAYAFMDGNPDITVDVQGGGSGQGIKSIKEGIANIGALSRNLKDEEKSIVGQEVVIALDGIAVIVNDNTNIENLTLEDIRRIYTGEITNWNQVGGIDALITVVSREEGSGTRGAFVEMTGIMNKTESGEELDMTTDKALIQPSTGSVLSTVANTPNTIGYVSIGGLNDTVKAIKVEGFEPSIETVKAGSYKISRPFIYVTADDIDEATSAYLDFVLSKEGQDLVNENGFISVI